MYGNLYVIPWMYQSFFPLIVSLKQEKNIPKLYLDMWTISSDKYMSNDFRISFTVKFRIIVK